MDAIDSNVSILTYQEKTIYLVGTAHISRESVELVEHIIRDVKPDSVAIELCEPRYRSLREPERWRNMDLFSVLRQGRGSLLLAQLGLAAFQRKLGSQLEVRPGAEMLKAADVAEEIGATVVLADREVRITLRRVWASLSFTSSVRLLQTAVGGLFQDFSISEQDIERLKQSDVLQKALDEFSESFPEVRRTLIDERDLYLTEGIRRSPGSTVVAVVGAGHCPGIKKSLEKDISLAELDQIPPRTWSGWLTTWSIPMLLTSFLLYMILTSGVDSVGHFLWMWVIVCVAYTVLGSIATLAHPITAAAMIITSPLTMALPVIRPGLVGALVEAWVKRPRVIDLETVLDDFSKLSGWYSNRVAHTLLIFLVNNILKWPSLATLGLIGVLGGG